MFAKISAHSFFQSGGPFPNQHTQTKSLFRVPFHMWCFFVSVCIFISHSFFLSLLGASASHCLSPQATENTFLCSAFAGRWRGRREKPLPQWKKFTFLLPFFFLWSLISTFEENTLKSRHKTKVKTCPFFREKEGNRAFKGLEALMLVQVYKRRSTLSWSGCQLSWQPTLGEVFYYNCITIRFLYLRTWPKYDRLATSHETFTTVCKDLFLWIYCTQEELIIIILVLYIRSFWWASRWMLFLYHLIQ